MTPYDVSDESSKFSEMVVKETLSIQALDISTDKNILLSLLR